MTALLAMLRRAAVAIVIVHAVKSVFALLAIGGLGLALVRAARGGDLTAQLAAALKAAPEHLAALPWAVLGYALVGPLLAQHVLGALLGGAVARGEQPRVTFTRYRRALGLSAARWLAAAAIAAGAFDAALRLPQLVAPELEHAARLGPLAAGALGLAWLFTAHDLAAARVAARDARWLEAAVCGARRTRGAALGLHAGYTAAALALFLAGEAAARALDTPALAFAATQAGALAAAFARAAWLAHALTLCGPARAPEARELSRR